MDQVMTALLVAVGTALRAWADDFAGFNWAEPSNALLMTSPDRVRICPPTRSIRVDSMRDALSEMEPLC